MTSKDPRRVRTGGAMALAAAALCTAAAPALADESFARQRFGEMSSYLGGQDALSFNPPIHQTKRWKYDEEDT